MKSCLPDMVWRFCSMKAFCFEANLFISFCCLSLAFRLLQNTKLSIKPWQVFITQTRLFNTQNRLLHKSDYHTNQVITKTSRRLLLQKPKHSIIKKDWQQRKLLLICRDVFYFLFFFLPQQIQSLLLIILENFLHNLVPMETIISVFTK